MPKIPILHRYLHYYSAFHRYVGHRTLLLGILSLGVTLSEGVGITVLIAYLQDLTAKGAAVSSLVEKMRGLFEAAGIAFTPGYVIPVMVSFFALRGVFVLFQKAYHFRLYTELLTKLTEHLASVISSMDYRHYLRRNSGYFTHLMTEEVNRSVTGYYQVSAMIPITVGIFTYLALSLRLEWRFTLLAIVFGLLTATIFRTVNRRIAASSREVSAHSSALTGVVIQFTQSFKYLFSTGSLGPLRDRVHTGANEVAKAQANIGFLAGILPASSETIIVTFLGVVVYVHAVVLRGDLSTLFVAMMFLYRCMREMTVLQGSWQAFNQYVGGIDKILEAIVEVERDRLPAGGVKVSGIQREIRADHVSFAYGEKEVLSDVSFTIPVRTSVAIVGESGAGKSTLVDLLTGLLSPTQGTLSLDGKNYRDLDLATFRQCVGYVTQESVVFDASVADNVSLWRWQRESDGEARVIRALERSNSLRFIQELPQRIREVVGERGVRLSGGQRQRLSIARELYKEPHLLILDEATSALDSESERLVQESIEGLKGMATVVVIAHRLSTVRNCDKILVLQRGRLVESGSFQELLDKKGPFQRMCELQSLA